MGLATALAGAAGCFPNPDALRPSSSSSSGGEGGAASPAGGSTGSGGTAGTAGHAGAGGNGAGGMIAPGAGGHVGAGGNAGGVGGGAGYVGSGLALTPDGTGWIAPTSNALGLSGGWYGFSDGTGPNGISTGGACENGGHPPSACSLISSPSPSGAGFPNTGGRMCVTGVAARVVNNTTTGLPDYGAIYGATIGFDFNTPAMSATKGTFNALANAITGIQFDIDLVPSNGLRVQFVTPGTDLGPGGPSYWGGSPAFSPSPVFIGTNRIYWADVSGPYGLGLDPTQLVSMYFNIPTLTTAADNFQFCISNVTLIRDTGPGGRACLTQTFPIYCPALNGVPSNCWSAGTNCNTIVSCAGVYKSCFGQAQTDYYDCTQLMCLRCSGAGPMACPGLGTVPPQCWPANTACSTVTDCGAGRYEGCSDPALSVDCTALTCN